MTHFVLVSTQVFILQLEGEKRWQLHKPPTKLPRDYSKDLDMSTIGQPTHDILLKVYLRGT